MKRWADYTLGLAIVMTHLVFIAVNEWKVAAKDKPRSLPN
jgi:hypothetical protein